MEAPEGVCIVTGANAGIGKEVTAGLMQEGHHVIMACRDMTRCEEARSELKQRLSPGSCECMRVDVGDYASVRSFARQALRELQAQRQKIKILLKINHLGPFLLTSLLLPELAQNARIINVASRAHQQGSLRIRDGKIKGTPSHWYTQYARSKLCNVLHVLELQRRLAADERHIRAYAVSPGRVRTRIFDNLPPMARAVLNPLAKQFFQTPKQGASTVLCASLSPEVLEDRNALYLHACKVAQPSRLALDRGLAEQLWDASESAVGL